MKSIRVDFNEKLNIKYFYEAFKRTSKNKRYKKEVLLFELNLEDNLYDLIDSIRNKTYQLSQYTEFKIYEPKLRIIKKLPFKDRIVQQWYIEEFIKPYYLKVFIYDSYACINNKGVHRCIKRLQSFIKDNDYAIKLDIKKYYESVDVTILKKILFKRMKDKQLICFTSLLIGDNLTIGNYTSQWFGNIYLNEVDYYIKHELKIKRFTRYLDDFCLLVKREEVKEVYQKIQYFLNKKLNLSLNNRSRYFKAENGIDFLGYKIYRNYILIKKQNLKKINKDNIDKYMGYLKWGYCGIINKIKNINFSNNLK